MTKFISNVNKYLSEMKIKQTYLSMITGIDKNKMSRLLTGSQEESGTDMEKIARGLGKNIEFFLADAINIPQGTFFTTGIALNLFLMMHCSNRRLVDFSTLIRGAPFGSR